MTTKKLLALLMAGAMSVSMLSGCGGSAAKTDDSSADAADTSASAESDMDYVKSNGKLVIGITDFAPMDYKEDGSDEWVGFDADMAKAFAESLGVKAEFIEINWDNKIMELDSKGVDAVWNGMTLTDEVKTSMNCSDPYATNAQVVVVPSDKADEVLRLKDAGAKVLMIGDGINDSPALSAADVGVTMRDGTDIAQEVADVIMAPSLEYLLVALDLGEATMKRIRSNVGISVGLNSAFLAGGLTGILMPAVSALLHNATTIGVCLNAMRPELGHYDGETRYADELRKDVADMFNRLGGVIRGVDSEAAGAPRVAVTALEATGVA